MPWREGLCQRYHIWPYPHGVGLERNCRIIQHDFTSRSLRAVRRYSNMCLACLLRNEHEPQQSRPTTWNHHQRGDVNRIGYPHRTHLLSQAGGTMVFNAMRSTKKVYHSPTFDGINRTQHPADVFFALMKHLESDYGMDSGTVRVARLCLRRDASFTCDAKSVILRTWPGLAALCYGSAIRITRAKNSLERRFCRWFM